MASEQAPCAGSGGGASAFLADDHSRTFGDITIQDFSNAAVSQANPQLHRTRRCIAFLHPYRAGLASRSIAA